MKTFTPENPIKHERLVGLIYGEAGIGKTTLGNAFEKSYMIDFDRGAHRAKRTKLVGQPENWSDVLSFLSAGIDDFDVNTLVIDTGGAMLDDFIAQHVMRMDPVNTNKSGSLSLKGYGVMKDIFKAFVAKCQAKGLDLLFICHAVEKSDGDDRIIRPKLTGGAYDILIAKCDFIGYAYQNGQGSEINFSPTQRSVGKDCAQLGRVKIPHFEKPDFQNFMGGVFAEIKARINETTEAEQVAINAIEQIKKELFAMSLDEIAQDGEKMLGKLDAGIVKEQAAAAVHEAIARELTRELEKVKTCDDANRYLKMVLSSGELFEKAGAKKIMFTRSIELGLTYNKESGVFESAKKPAKAAAK